jgi:hypothetical protein
VTINNEAINFNSKNSWEKKINTFLSAEAELMNFGSLGLSFTNTRNKSQEIENNFSYNYTKISKMHLKFKDLEPTKHFIKKVEEAIKSSKPIVKLREISKEFGQFVPTKVTLGGIVYYMTESESKRSTKQNINEISPTYWNFCSEP